MNDNRDLHLGECFCQQYFRFLISLVPFAMPEFDINFFAFFEAILHPRGFAAGVPPGCVSVGCVSTSTRFKVSRVLIPL